MKTSLSLIPFLVVAGFLGLSSAQAQHHHGGYHRDYHHNYHHGSGAGLFFNFDFTPRPVYAEPVYVERRYVVHHNVVVDVQAQLNRRGYNAGPVDGAMGPQTSSAIAQFQRDRGLRVTGDINEAVLRSLGL